MKIFRFTTIIALAVMAVHPAFACPYAGKNYSAKNGTDTMNYSFDATCSTVGVGVNGSEQMTIPLASKGKRWVGRDDGVKVTFSANGKSATVQFSNGKMIKNRLKPVK